MVQLSLEDRAKTAIRTLQEFSAQSEMKDKIEIVKMCIADVEAAKLDHLLTEAWQTIISKMTPSDGIVMDSVDTNVRFLLIEGLITRQEALLLQSTRMINRIVYGGQPVNVQIAGMMKPPESAPAAQQL